MPDRPQPNFLRAFDIREKADRPTARRSDYIKKWGWHLWSANIGISAVGIVIANIPYTFNGQHAIGCIYYFVNLVFLIMNIIMTTLRIFKYPSIVKQSFFDHNEAVWFPVTGLTLATFIIMTLLYGVPNVGQWLTVVCEVLFYILVAYALAIQTIMEQTLRTVPRPLKFMSPPDCLESYPLMFIGVVGGTLAPQVYKYSASRALTIIMLGYLGAGLGFYIGLLKLSVWMTRKLVYGRAPSQIIPSYIVATGVPGFTCFSVLTLGNAALDVFPANDFLSGAGAGDAALVAQVFFFGGILLSFLFAGMACWVVIVYWGWVLGRFVREPLKDPRKRWAFTWWSWDFPLTGLVVSFGRYAQWLPSKAFGVIMIIFVFWMVILSFINLIGTAHMIITGKLPGTADEYEEMVRNGKHDNPTASGDEGSHDVEQAAALFAPPRM